MRRVITSLLVVLGFTGCASKQVDTTSHQLFRYKNEQDKDAFTFILMAKDSMAEFNKKVEKLANSAPELIMARMPSDPELPAEDEKDQQVAPKFRMEELAFKKLEAELKNINYCVDGYQTVDSEYKKLRYVIKGVCH